MFLKRGKIIVITSVVLIMVLIVFKTFILDLYFVPSSSMENTIKSKKYILVEKYSYGAKMPENTHKVPILSMIFKNFKPIKLWENKRTYGINKLQKGDIALFKKKPLKFIKRIVAMPKDTIVIKNGFLSTNNTPEQILDTYKYIFESKLDETNQKLFKINRYLGKNLFEVEFTGESLKNHNLELTAINPIEGQKHFDNYIFPNKMHPKWDINNYGKLIVPYKGMSIDLRIEKNLILYKSTIINHEPKNENLSEMKFYEFKQDYYFFMGDNRMDSIDSRFFGFIPQKDILGKLLISL